MGRATVRDMVRDACPGLGLAVSDTPLEAPLAARPDRPPS